MLSAEGGRNVAVGDDASVAVTQHRDGDIVGRGHDIAFVAGVAKDINCVFAVFFIVTTGDADSRDRAGPRSFPLCEAKVAETRSSASSGVINAGLRQQSDSQDPRQSQCNSLCVFHSYY